ncbi:hypothetical protein [Heyndrickxia camelliae]|uniref:Uncharacterized protein n=1 Tax=Heyndrickxia camelliae TaxID=1707093 RepID=A0A2N3LD62_9BACI|nr:hypothetical protein [Heyndrickxia camelliae]PKR82592.1 hypothetical protein CWO92_23705 [Heyndrickxia camelliae]
MNAAEARKISKGNEPNLISQCADNIIKLTKIQIQTAAKEGHYSVGARYEIPWNIKEKVIPQVVLYFECLGYEVEHKQLTEIDLFIIKW